MVRTSEVEWMVAAAEANGLSATVRPHAIGMEAVAQSTTAGVPWHVRARVVVHSSSDDQWTDRYVVCTAPTLAAPLLSLEEVRAGAVPTRIAISRTDSALGSSGELLGDALVLATQLVAKLWGRKRREAREESPDRPPTVDMEPEDAVPGDILEALRTWRGRDSEVAFRLAAAMDTPLTLRATYWQDPVAFGHQLAVWQSCVQRLATTGLLVRREESSIPAAADHVQACAAIVSQRVRDELRRRR